MLIETVVEEGVVKSVETGECVVRMMEIDPDVCKGCGLCLVDPDKAAEKHELRVCGSGNEAVGDRVRVEIRRPNPAAAAGVVFGIPMASMAGFAALGAFVSNLAGVDQAIGGAVGAAIGLVPAVLAARLFQGMWAARGAFKARIIGPAVTPPPPGDFSVGSPRQVHD